jgi:hypothetical protein
MRIILALTVRKFEIVPTKDVYRVLKLTVGFSEVELI